MAVSANALADLTADQVATMAVELAGLMPAGAQLDPKYADQARRFMRAELASLQTGTPISQTIERTTLSLVEGTAAYTLPNDTLDIELGPNDQAGTIVPSSGAESVVFAMTRAEYLDLSDKTSTSGRPTRVYVERLATTRLIFDPIPDSTSATFRYARVRLLWDVDTGGVTLDLARRWIKAIAYLTATSLARANSREIIVVRDLQSTAEKLVAECKAEEIQRPRIRWRLSHSGRNF